MVNFNNSVHTCFKSTFFDYVEDITRGFSIPDKKLISDLMWGTLSSGCLLISDIARKKHEENTLSNIENRLTRRMREFDYERLYDRIESRAFSIFTSPYSLCIDEIDRKFKEKYVMRFRSSDRNARDAKFGAVKA